MNRSRMMTVTLGLLSTFVAPALRGDESNKETRMTINAPLQVQGTLLSPGQHVFRLTQPDTSLNVVSIYNAETNRLEGIVLGWQTYRVDAGDKQLFTIDQAHGNEPAQLKQWYYPGDNFGVEFSLSKHTRETGHLKPDQRGGSVSAAADASSTRD